MTDVAVPFWLFICVALLALVGFIDRILTPTVRWLVRRKVNAVIDELNQRLPLKIQPFRMTKRAVLIDRLAHDPAVINAAEDHAREENVPMAVALDQARKYAREIVPAFNAYAYFRIGARLAKWLATALYRVRLGYADSAALEKVDPESSVVFVMNHRSNMDYVLVTYLASTSTALSYAVGEWARIAGLQQLIRLMGAYFIRRNSRGGLYRKVLARYVQMATEAGVPQAMFPEGGLSRDGLLKPAKLGLLAYIVAAWKAGGRDVVFVPVGLNYDRVLEDRTLIAEHAAKQTGQKPPRVSPVKTAWNTLAFLGHNLSLRLRGRWHRFGYAAVSFGTPVSLAAFFDEAKVAAPDRLEEAERNALVETLAERLMAEVGRHVPALPVSLAATALLAAPDGLDELELKAGVFSLMAQLEGNGAYVHVPRADRDYAVTAGLRMLLLRRIVDERAGRFHVAAGQEPVTRYYANAIAHLVGASSE
ncbi:MAG: 1-acyl-sn-glycerol-3-phosphate acyltransferase [Rhizobiaceae bacterium]|nr:1-acyl-sn-glycerol-3-phosphate acyltransferase [Rhizobiaceae bacterium]